MTAVEFGLLGAIEARVDGHQVDLGHARQRHVLAALLVDADRLVPITDLAARIWGDRTPHSGLTPLYGYLSRLRQALAPAEQSVRIVRQPGGYMAAVNPATVDLHSFRQLMARARTTDEPTGAIGLFNEALELWRGEPFSGVDNPWFNTQRAALLRERESAEIDLRDLKLRCGLHAEVLTEVTGAFEADPMNERVAGQLMLALYRQGRPAEALTCYDRVRARLAEELGVPPSPQLQRLHLRILEADPDLLVTSRPAVPEQQTSTQARAWSAPASLPAKVPDFTGRLTEIATLIKHLTGDWGSMSPVTTIVGMGGIGKTALSVHVAHHAAASYPDGQLWANLQGANANPAKPADVLARFLRALGVPERAIPADPDERVETYRTLVNGRKILVLLDDAASEEQVRPLLPGTPTCAVVVTSRARLIGLEGAHRVDLDVFAADEAVDLLTQIVGEDRVTRELFAASEIVTLCGGLPLAVRIAGARLAARPAWSLAHLASMLGDERRRLDQLSAGDLAVRASLALSYRGLDDQPRRLFRLLGLFSAPDFPPWLASVVLERPIDEATECAEALVDAQLLTTSGTDAAGQYRYRFHDLVRLFAAERAAEEETGESRARALEQGLGGWLSLAHRMSASVPGPCFAPISSPAPRPRMDHVLRDFRPEWAADWFDAERGALLAAVRQACRLRLADLAFDLAACMEKYFDVRGMYTDWITLNTEVLVLCRECGNALGEAVMLRGLIDVTTWAAERTEGDAMARQYAEATRLKEMFTELGLPQGSADAALMCSWSLTANGAYPDAITMADEALELATRAGHLGGQARAELSLALAHFENRDVMVAIGHANNALDRARELGNARCYATALQFAGIGHHALGHFDTSKQMLDESLAISRSYRDNYTEVLTLLALARLYFRVGDEAARPTAETAVALSREYNMSHHLAEALEILGSIEVAAGNPAKAVPHLEESVALWRTRGWHSFHAIALTSLGKAYADSDPEAARRAFRSAHDLFVQVGNLDQAAEVARLAER
ncbi:BTAD domain-containing putative transcriptional regulator [Kibdelosporangium persicum]|uniref:Transcriptional regulator n=1 Tax=Kibdelosporangium persicum TaxID=2698649 RepID=A0ABX2F173_9PSEU|nr:BTAD domain-containing putative transcriptional regulator [Kibdelosporangium persicum]NRN65074.1 Transcriptional regulator [Kibdelosporangium persicum]